MSKRTIPSAPSGAAIFGAGAAFGVSTLGAALGSWIETRWNTTVISWEMAGLAVCVLVTFCGFFVGAAAGMIRRVVIGTLLGAVITGACLAAVSLTNGSPRLPLFARILIRTPVVTYLVPRLVGLGFWRVHVEGPDARHEGDSA